MAKPASKRGSKQHPKPAANGSTAQSPKTDQPSPYSTPPPVLRPFLESLNPEHIYITHIDGHSRRHKMRIFAMSVWMNIAMAALLFWRVHKAVPFYASLIGDLMSGINGLDAIRLHPPYSALIIPVVRRVGTIVADLILVRFFLTWPMDFFLGPQSPIHWRLAVGFQDEEVIVRRSKKWDETLPKDWLAEEADGSVYAERIMPAINRQFVEGKTGYLMTDKSWNLDYASMVQAHDLVKDGRATFKDFRKAVIVYSEDHGWLVWSVWKLDEGAPDEERQKIVGFRDKLAAMGKEELFFKWVELIQLETTQPGGFTRERQEITLKKARELFDSNGVDFEQFLKEAGVAQN
jgi:hypothetical protein